MSTFRSVLSPQVSARIFVGWGSALALMLCAPMLSALPTMATWLILAAVVAVILYAAFGVVHQAEALAHRLGDPYGSLILTISIVLIEVILIASVLLGPGEHATIARDSVLAVMMIILGLVVGVAILIGAKPASRGATRVQKRGTTSYMGMIIALSVVAFMVPFALPEGTYSGTWALVIAAVSVAGYGLFLARQMGPRARDYRELGESTSAPIDVRSVVRENRAELLVRTLVLIVTVVPIVLMSHDMSALMDTAFTAAGAPAALAGVVIAAIVFTPETITTLRAARAGEFQRVVNLCLGAFVSTVGLTIPVVLVIGEITGQRITLAPDAVSLGLIGAIIAAMVLAFKGGTTTRLRGVLPLVIFAGFVVVIAVS